jgi:DNA-binding transcriptional LysR family regulator
VLAAFRAERPGVELKIRHAGGSSEMAEHVRDGRLDLAFVALPNRRLPGVELTPLAREPIVLAVPAGHPLSQRTRIELAALSDETVVDLPPGWGTRIAIDRSFAAADVTRTVTYEVNDTASMIDFIRHGLAVGMLPASFVEAPDDIAFVPIRHHAPQFETALAVPSNRRLSAATQALVDTIKRHAAV